jgi:phosphoribosyl-AMP cyclohydrolase
MIEKQTMTDTSALHDSTIDLQEWVKTVQWNQDGLMTAIAQDHIQGTVLMLGWMNRQALIETVKTGHAVYFSRSRQRLWHKGETSGHQQKVHGIYLDCDHDAILLKVEQIGGIACHTGRHHCFFYQLDTALSVPQWKAVEPVLKDPKTIYPGSAHHD